MQSRASRKNSSVAQQIGAAGDTLYSLNGVNAPVELVASLEAHGVTVNDNTLIEVRSMQANYMSGNIGTNTVMSDTDEVSTVEKTSLVITNVDGIKVSKTMIMSLDEENVSDSSVSVCTYGNEEIYPFDDNRCYIITTVEYNQFQNPNTFNRQYYQPLAAMLYYFDGDGDVVDYVDMIYNCVGYEYTYPEFEPFNDSWEPYVHQIAIGVENPVHQGIYMEFDCAYPEYRCGDEESEEDDMSFTNSVILTESGFGEHSVVWHIYDGADYVWGSWRIISE